MWGRCRRLCHLQVPDIGSAIALRSLPHRSRCNIPMSTRMPDQLMLKLIAPTVDSDDVPAEHVSHPMFSSLSARPLWHGGLSLPAAISIWIHAFNAISERVDERRGSPSKSWHFFSASRVAAQFLDMSAPVKSRRHVC